MKKLIPEKAMPTDLKNTTHARAEPSQLEAFQCLMMLKCSMEIFTQTKTLAQMLTASIHPKLRIQVVPTGRAKRDSKWCGMGPMTPT